MTHGDSQIIAALGTGNKFDEQVADAIEDGATDMEASQVDVDSTSLVGVGTNVQTVLEELDDAIVAAETSVSNHLADASDAHDASAVSVADSATWTAAADVEAAIAELFSRVPRADTLAADVDVAEDATANATGLSIAVKANQVFVFELDAVCTASVNGGIRLGFTYPAGTVMEFTTIGVDADDSLFSQPGADQTNEVTYKASALSEDLVLVKGRITVGANAGNVVVAFAQDTSHTDTSTLHAESTLLLVPVV